MRQVPKYEHNYLVVGNGKLAKHFINYFTLLKIPFIRWHRKHPVSISLLKNKTAKILLLINDSEIENFIINNLLPLNSYQKIIHCSGILSTELAMSAHPLMTFSNRLYDLDIYKSIHFVTEKGKSSFKELFPELLNSSTQIKAEEKKQYHLWCSMSGNFTSILWKEFFNNMEKLGIKKEVTIPYLYQIFQNVINEKEPVTGPLVRKDTNTIQKHISIIKDTPFEKIYSGFAELYNINIMGK